MSNSKEHEEFLSFLFKWYYNAQDKDNFVYDMNTFDFMQEVITDFNKEFSKGDKP